MQTDKREFHEENYDSVPFCLLVLQMEPCEVAPAHTPCKLSKAGGLLRSLPKLLNASHTARTGTDALYHLTSETGCCGFR